MKPPLAPVSMAIPSIAAPTLTRVLLGSRDLNMRRSRIGVKTTKSPVSSPAIPAPTVTIPSVWTRHPTASSAPTGRPIRHSSRPGQRRSSRNRVRAAIAQRRPR